MPLETADLCNICIPNLYHFIIWKLTVHSDHHKGEVAENVEDYCERFQETSWIGFLFNHDQGKEVKEEGEGWDKEKTWQT